MINDDELIQIFIEEARDLLENLNRYMEEWRCSLNNVELMVPILRELHTLKGSARMMGLLDLNEYTHSLEKFVQKINQREILVTIVTANDVQISLDFIHSYIDEYANSKTQSNIEIASQDFQRLLDLQNEPKETKSETELLAGTQNKSKQHAISDVIRIKTDLLDNFGQLADQINISRSNLEQHVKGAMDLISDIFKQTKLMQEQMRQIQLKADSNLSMQALPSEKKYEDFDVLELDRYSVLQQATRSLGEKLDHLEFLNNQVSHIFKSTEVSLIEQKRTVMSLVEGITHTRLISIENLIPRLKRVVRQVSHELQKEVHLEFAKVEGEIDRKALEKLIPPFEHMLRNAIDHGIEFPSIRQSVGKKPYGIITISTFRQGNDILVQFEDDGRGIDPAIVREKAIERKLWDPNASMSKAEAIQMIFLPGFTTKDSVSPISGQGVGLDVVNTEVNKLGGSLRIDTQLQRGTKFTIRLPFASSLNQVLVFEASKKLYALQLSHLSGLTRVTPNQIQEMKIGKQHFIDYANQRYELWRLTTLLGEDTDWQKTAHIPKPVIFLQSENNYIAILVDKLIGSCELVIKPPGAQLQFVREIAGISILADEHVVIVLDPQSLILRALNNSGVELHKQRSSFPPKDMSVLTNTKVLIVDDSITVRKITSRFLKRFGYEPLTAKDGEEAFLHMEDILPDIILLDIEMPKMDGFQFLKLMKNNPKYKDIPIIMITSRSGEKHRSTAMNMGANAYLSKPFAEAELLALIRKFKPSLY